jgi:hypothetical protein
LARRRTPTGGFEAGARWIQADGRCEMTTCAMLGVRRFGLGQRFEGVASLGNVKAVDGRLRFFFQNVLYSLLIATQSPSIILLSIFYKMFIENLCIYIFMKIIFKTNLLI